MSPPRFYCPQIASLPAVPEACCFLEPAEAKHATSVLRLKVDELITVFDGAGRSALGKIIEARRESLGFEIQEWQTQQPSSPHSLTLMIALPKGDRQKMLVDAATELGVTRLIPLRCQRGVAQPTDNALERLRRQVIEACKQCGRNRLMEIGEPMELGDLPAQSGLIEALRLVAHPYADAGPTQSLVSQLRGPARSCDLAIGPEGGFTTGEVEQLISAGWQAVTLGSLILRIEVAALAAVAQVAGWMQTGEQESS